MITDLFISFIAGILDIILFSWIPLVTTMPAWYDTVSSTFAVMTGLGAFPVLGTVIQIMLLILTFMAGWQAVVWGNWLYNKIRGSG